MRFTHPDGSRLHLGYGTNVHPAEDVESIAAQLAGIATAVRRELDVPMLGLGLWLSAAAARDLRCDPEARTQLRRLLTSNGLEVVTLNGFPYGGFHAPVVKRDVYRPDWSEPARASYALDLAHVLADLLPDDVTTGSISTLPLGWDAWMDVDRRATARDALRRVGDDLDRLRETTGREIRLGLEPEPGCTLATATQVLDEVAAIGHPAIGIALDACHLAVEFEDPVEVAAAVRAGPGDAVKLQLSNALRVEPDEHEARRAELLRHVEPRFLHQTRTPGPDGVLGTDDLDVALDGALPTDDEWRIHFHVPLDAGSGTTDPVLRRTLAEVLGGVTPLTHHLEVETYTWSVLPEDRRPTTEDALARALADELRWARSRLIELGCTEELT